MRLQPLQVRPYDKIGKDCHSLKALVNYHRRPLARMKRALAFPHHFLIILYMRISVHVYTYKYLRIGAVHIYIYRYMIPISTS